MLKSKVLSFLLSILVAVSVCAITVNETGATVQSKQKESLVTLNVANKPLKDALNEISDQTGYTILIEKEFQRIPVSGSYQEVSIEEFIRRALRGK